MKKTVIKFYADWCQPCLAYAPIFEKVKQDLESDQIEFVEVNVDKDSKNLSGEYGVKGIPHTVLLEEGVKVKEQSGRMSGEILKEFILN
jgi:thioredoxin 1